VACARAISPSRVRHFQLSGWIVSFRLGWKSCLLTCQQSPSLLHAISADAVATQGQGTRGNYAKAFIFSSMSA
jgi:hypothetical protein